MRNTACPCGSKKPFETCCEPIIAGVQLASTPEALMRSRYSAYATMQLDYIYDSMRGPALKDADQDATTQWASSCHWLGLEVVSSAMQSETEGTVYFIATYQQNSQVKQLQERSRFLKEDGRWFYVDGKSVMAPINSDKKVGRNAPCPCGSGKKYKVCCGRQ